VVKIILDDLIITDKRDRIQKQIDVLFRDWRFPGLSGLVVTVITVLMEQQ
jgi:hypothetical protein